MIYLQYCPVIDLLITQTYLLYEYINFTKQAESFITQVQPNSFYEVKKSLFFQMTHLPRNIQTNYRHPTNLTVNYNTCKNANLTLDLRFPRTQCQQNANSKTSLLRCISTKRRKSIQNHVIVKNNNVLLKFKDFRREILLRRSSKMVAVFFESSVSSHLSSPGSVKDTFH